MAPAAARGVLVELPGVATVLGATGAAIDVATPMVLNTIGFTAIGPAAKIHRSCMDGKVIEIIPWRRNSKSMHLAPSTWLPRRGWSVYVFWSSSCIINISTLNKGARITCLHVPVPMREPRTRSLRSPFHKSGWNEEPSRWPRASYTSLVTQLHIPLELQLLYHAYNAYFPLAHAGRPTCLVVRCFKK